MKVYFEDGELSHWTQTILKPDLAVYASLGVSLNLNVLDWQFKQDPNATVYTNSIFAFNNRYAWNNELKVPEIYIRAGKNNEFTRIDKLTNRVLKEGHNLAKMYISGEFDTDINVGRNEVTDEIRKEVHNYLDCEILEDELLDDKCYAFYYKCMKAGLHSADADRYASLNTLLNYDIGIDNAMTIDKWMYNHHTDIFELKATDNEDKMFLALAVAELGLDIDFGGWITEDYTEYSYF